MKYIKEFDTLRAISVTLVIIGHFFQNFWLWDILPIGMIGVSFFFVLSGKLITSILLKAKENGNSVGGNLKNFYFRRALRIFPAYYFFLALCYWLGNGDLKNHLIYFLTYMQNILFFRTLNYASELGPTWTLAVEEQFYVLWPLIILYCPSRSFYKLFWGIIFFSPLFRLLVILFCKYYGINSSLNLALMPSNLICLVSGALLSISEFNNEKFLKKILSPVIPIFLFLSYLVLYKFIYIHALSIIQQIIISIISFWLLNYIIHSEGSTCNNLLKNKFTTYIGKISYGMYLYHLVAFKIFELIFKQLKDLKSNPTLVGFVIDYAIILLFSSLSWFIFEKPLNELKKYFSYTKKTQQKILQHTLS